jgi:hypothetical protein
VIALRRNDGPTLTVDLRSNSIDSWSDLWNALANPCGLPGWFGRNLDAWWDAIHTGGISDVLDDHSLLVVRLRPGGLFARGNLDGARFVQTTNESEYARVELEAPNDARSA